MKAFFATIAVVVLIIVLLPLIGPVLAGIAALAAPLGLVGGTLFMVAVIAYHVFKSFSKK